MGHTNTLLAVPSVLRFDVGTFRPGRKSWVPADGTEVNLSCTESELLQFMAARAGEIVSRAVLLREVWGYARGVRSRAVDNAVARLRSKIEPHPSRPRVLVSVYGRGYRLEGLVASPDPVERSVVDLLVALARVLDVSLGEVSLDENVERVA